MFTILKKTIRNFNHNYNKYEKIELIPCVSYKRDKHFWRLILL